MKSSEEGNLQQLKTKTDNQNPFGFNTDLFAGLGLQWRHVAGFESQGFKEIQIRMSQNVMIV